MIQVSTKLDVLNAYSQTELRSSFGGGHANTFLRRPRYPVGKRCRSGICWTPSASAERFSVPWPIVRGPSELPKSALTGESGSSLSAVCDHMILDISPNKTAAAFLPTLLKFRLVLFCGNGPVGVFVI